MAAPQLVTINVASNNPEALANFYSKLTGVQFTRSLTSNVVSYHAPVTASGVQMTITTRQKGENTVPYFAVDNLDTAVAALTQAGGKVSKPSYNLPIAPAAQGDFAAKYGAGAPTTLGTANEVRDPDGNFVGLIQLHPAARVLFNLDNATLTTLAQKTLAQHQDGIPIAQKFAATIK